VVSAEQIEEAMKLNDSRVYGWSLYQSLQPLFICTVISVMSLFVPSVHGQIAQAPLLQAQNIPPLVMLTLGRDEKLYNPAYNDYSDVDGDGIVDVGYKPTIQYFGYFDSFKCYDYDTTAQRFKPSSVTATKKCSSKWSGDFLNYITTSRIDALRRVMYGGRRVTDSGTLTVLERSYIPQDAHTWGREYDAAVDLYLISDYTPLAQPTAGTRHFFANTSLNGSPGNPLMRVLTSRTERIWNWVAKEGPVADSVLDGSGASVAPTDYIVRVEACVAGLLEAECKGYPASLPVVYKPTGVLHDYGENRSIAFGLLSGSYQNQRSGGVLRKNMSYFDDEIDAATGQFKTTIYGIVHHIDQLKITQWGPGYPGGCLAGNCKDYGSPTAEMMYETMRYFGGGLAGASAYDYTDAGSVDASLNLKKVSWLDPYRGTAAGGYPYCAKPVQMVFSDVYPSYDSDQLPGSAFATFTAPSAPSTLSGFNATNVLSSISTAEGIAGQYFIGESLDNTPNTDRSPSLKTVTSLSRIRGLAPGEPTRQGSYYAASVARYGKVTDVSAATNSQKVTTYAIALSAPLPKLSFTVGGTKVSLIPFGQSVGGCDYGDYNSTTRPMQNRIAAFYIDRIVNIPGFATDSSASTGNSGRPYGRFRVSFEDNIEGTDNDMDAIVSYEFAVNAAGQLRINLVSEYAAGCIDQHMGYIISGTTQDGTYLGVRDVDGGCNTSPLNDSAFSTGSGKCTDGLGFEYSRTFTLSAAAASADANIPRDPLFYAAKWGGPGVDELSGTPASETVVNGLASVPGYFYVSDPQKLRAQLTAAFSQIVRQSAPTTAAVATGSFVRTDSALFLPGYVSEKLAAIDAEPDDTGAIVGSLVWDGTLEARKFQTSGTGVTLVPFWSVSNSSFPVVDSVAKTTTRKVFTKIGSNKNALFLPANLDATLRTKLAPASTQALLATYLVSKLGPTATAAAKEQETAEQVALYVLGNRKLEQRKGGPLRSRRALLGDIVNSTPAYQSKLDEGWGVYGTTMPEAASYGAFVNGKTAAPTLYVGANDGMLHAFNATTGAERWAFLPEVLQTALPKLVDPAYSHRYFVDGQLTISDAYWGGSWRSVLVGALGAGGKSVFAIDVTNPTAPTVLWEFVNEDLGYLLSKPSIIRLRDGTWVAIFSNGYESARVVSATTKTVGRLFVVKLSDGTSLGTIGNLTVTDQLVTNGLGAPAITARGGIADSAWVGDLAGNLWKYDLGFSATSSTASSVKVAYSGAPLFKAVRSGVAQPITSEPSVVSFPEGGQLVVFGTGKFFENSDLTTTATQSIYSIWDAAGWSGLGRSDLAVATVSDSGDYRSFAGVTNWWSGPSAKYGWYADLPNAGERIVAPSTSLFGLTIISSLIANTSDPCVINKDGLLMAVSPITGGNPQVPVFDANKDGVINASDKVAGNVIGGIRLTDPVSLVAINSGGSAVGYDAKGNAQIQLPGGKPQGRRNWRLVQ
jgi:type IV pilus assembly protein PilY1